MSKELKEVRILMLGESGVGKTSLILSLISEQFYDESVDPSYEIPAKLEPITIPAEVTAENIPGVIIDYSSREQNEQDLVREIEKADVICLVYAMNDASSKEKLNSYYLPKIREVEELGGNSAALSSTLASGISPSNSFSASTPQPNASSSFASFEAPLNKVMTASKTAVVNRRPIVIVANKSDLNGDRASPIRDPLITQLITNNSQIETCIECSAKTIKNVPEVFYYAQKSVLFPTSPIYDAEKKQLTTQAVKCLTRIFRICDADNDGILNDQELADFQLKCFNLRLNGSTLQEVKSILRNSDENRNNYLVNNGITLQGFLHLHELFINKGRHETSWTVLKKFGYDRNLTFNREYAHPSLKVPPTCSVELSLRGFEFLQYLFNKHDLDRDDCLNRKELEDLFSICPIKMPWGNDVHNSVCAIADDKSTATTMTSKLTFIGFLSQWVLTTYFDHKTTIELFAYLGYNHLNDEGQLSALTVSRPKEVDVAKKQTHRNAFLCYVFGRKKCGKTAFLQGLLGRDLQSQAQLSPDEVTRWSCNLVQFQNIEKYLILKEINSGDIEFHEVYPPDVVILMYDLTDPNSFSFIADIFLTVYKDRPIPCMLVGTKCDQTEIPQKYPITAEKFAEMYKLPPPQYFSASTSFLNKSDLYAKILAMANYPKMYPMGSQIWRFFEKIGAATSLNSGRPSPYRSLASNALARGSAPTANNEDQSLASKLSYLNPLSFFFNSDKELRPRSARDPDSMVMRYSLLAAGCLCVTFLIVKMMRN